MEKEIRLSYIKKIDEVNKNGKYKPDWSSLSEYGVPEWYKKAKFGVFIHWGLFTVPEYFSEWYPRLMYYKGNPLYWHHKRKYGKYFNYRDFIELFRAEKFDAAEWVSAVKSCGARFIMPVAEHHDRFKLYNSDLNEWTSVKTGPKKDFLGAIKTECEKQNLIFSASSHRAEHFWFLNGGKTIGFKNETQNEKYREFYGACENVHKFNNLYTLNTISLKDAKALPKNSETEKEMRLCMIEIARQEKRSKKLLSRCYENGIQEFDYSVFDSVVSEISALEKRQAELIDEIKQEKKNKQNTLSSRKELSEIKRKTAAAKRSLKQARDEFSLYNRAAKPFLDAKKLLTQQENYLHYEEIKSRYNESKARAEAQREALSLQEKRNKAEKEAYAAKLREARKNSKSKNKK